MISKGRIKYIKSLELKKNRNREKAFVAEGPKVVSDLLDCMPARIIVATKEWLENNLSRYNKSESEVIEVSDEELRKVSFLQHPQQVLAVFPKIENIVIPEELNSDLVLALDDVQDPGNLGTIIRIADWFGITKIICSQGTADVYNLKVVQATMGSISRVCVVYTDLVEFIDKLHSDMPVYGTFLDGDNIYEKRLTECGLIVMGNEGNGISHKLREMISNKLLIPNFPQDRATTDSLNVAVATAIICSEFRRKTSYIQL